jgi:hypothetical protein
VSDLVPGNALDPTVMLATSVHAQPGVYALLLGSGVSTGAGILTGWGIIKDLVRRAAAAQAPDDAEAPDRALDDPEAWWAEHGDGHPLGYSNLLEALASTPAARRNLIARLLRATEDEVDEGQKTPSPSGRSRTPGLLRR